jgi:hypothetical protein
MPQCATELTFDPACSAQCSPFKFEHPFLSLFGKHNSLPYKTTKIYLRNSYNKNNYLLFFFFFLLKAAFKVVTKQATEHNMKYNVLCSSS